MSGIVVTYEGSAHQLAAQQAPDTYTFAPQFRARLGGDQAPTVIVSLSGLAAEIVRARLSSTDPANLLRAPNRIFVLSS
jgi:uncharacterized protein YigE (DUF2233 family)